MLFLLVDIMLRYLLLPGSFHAYLLYHILVVAKSVEYYANTNLERSIPRRMCCTSSYMPHSQGFLRRTRSSLALART